MKEADKRGRWMNVALYSDEQEEEEEEAEEAGHGQVAHCCRVTGIVGGQAGGCRAAQVHTGWRGGWGWPQE